MARATQDEIRAVKRALGDALDAADASFEAGASALASLLLDVFVELIRSGNAKAADEMRRMSDRLQVLAAEPASTIEQRSIQLADVPGATHH